MIVSQPRSITLRLSCLWSPQISSGRSKVQRWCWGWSLCTQLAADTTDFILRGRDIKVTYSRGKMCFESKGTGPRKTSGSPYHPYSLRLGESRHSALAEPECSNWAFHYDWQRATQPSGWYWPYIPKLYWRHQVWGQRRIWSRDSGRVFECSPTKSTHFCINTAHDWNKS
jgi:hypothetical protein